eukprot:TRINITY_DN27522_c0_g1_i1.p1 TRINITY_DN27522_c0_g1~~TRINITY_DN27522_c0_g1_i1.p1  ORF type:complete len:365 (+),score=60.29 TRINITY_DN27522_c0_g1_i1:237-1331(+)
MGRVCDVRFQDPGDVGYYIKIEDDEKSPNDLPLPLIKPQKVKKAWQFGLSVFLCTTLWWASAVCVILEIKWTVSTIFPYPFTMTALVQPVTGLLAWVVSLCLDRNRHRDKPPVPALQRKEIFQLLAIGSIQGFEIALTNKALGFLGVATRTMVSSTGVLFMMLTAFAWGLEKLGCLRMLSAAAMITGGCLQGVEQRQRGQPSEWIGILMQLVSMILSAQRWVLAQFVMQFSSPESALGRMSKLSLLARVLPVTGVVSVLLAAVFEPEAFQLEEISQKAVLLRTLAVSVGLVGMLFAELKLVGMLSAVAFNVLSTVHQIPIVAAGVVLQHEEVGFASTCGFVFCLLGALLYACARQADKQALEQE